MNQECESQSCSCSVPHHALRPTHVRAGVPAGAYWVRVQSDWLRLPPADFALTSIPQEDDFALIYGKKEDVARFLAQVREVVREEAEAKRRDVGVACGPPAP